MSRHFSPYPRFALLLGLVLTLFGLSAGAATFTVANLNDSGPGSLRQAILDANATVDDDTIVFQSGLSGTITLTTGEIDISSNLAINGPGANVLAVSGNKASRIFLIRSGQTVTINGLTLKDGFAGNVAGSNGGGIHNNGTLTVSNSTLSGNSGNFGGGICNVGGTLTVANSTLSGNLSTTAGGGIANFDITAKAGGILTVTNSTLSGNSAGEYFIGGGIASTGGILTVSNSTLSGNSASGGGGIGTGGGTLTVTNSTLSGNSASDGGGILSSTLKLGNSLVAGNTASTGNEVYAGAFTSLGHNLFGENGISGVEGGALAPTDIVPTVGISAILAPLGDYGGPTQTHLLVPGSPAIDAGDNALIPAGVTTDQRGFPRIQNGTVDIGAVEVGSATDIPTLSQWALLLLGILLAGGVWLTHTGRTRPL